MALANLVSESEHQLNQVHAGHKCIDLAYETIGCCSVIYAVPASVKPGADAVLKVPDGSLSEAIVDLGHDRP